MRTRSSCRDVDGTRVPSREATSPPRADTRRPPIFTRISVAHFVSKSLTILSLVALFANSGLAAAESTSVTVAALKEFSSDMRSRANRTDVAQYFTLPKSVLSLVTAKSKAKPKTRETIDRIRLTPANITLTQGRSMDFTATGMRGERNVAGVDFRWTITKADSGQTRPLPHGRFTAKVPGAYTVRVTADNVSAEAQVRVTPNPGYNVERILSKPERDRTPAEREIVAGWIASGALTVRQSSSWDPYQGAVSQARERAARKKKEEARRIAAENEKAAQAQEQAEAQKGRGPNAAEPESANEENSPAPATPARRFSLADPSGWDGSNYMTADDTINAVGRPIGAAKDKGAANGNYNLSIPALSVPGRGLDLNLNLEYNSRLWSNTGSGLTFNADGGYPAPGWSLGFGKLIYLGTLGGCMLAASDGNRRPYKTDSFQIFNSGGVYREVISAHTVDGSMIDYKCLYTSSSSGDNFTGEATYPDGTVMLFGTTSYNRDQAFPTSIRDAHGNFISIKYRWDPYYNTYFGPELSEIKDTLGRDFYFDYDGANNLTAIRGPGYGSSTRYFLRFQHWYPTFAYNFPSTTLSIANPSPIQLMQIYDPGTGNGYWFGDSDSYSPYGMIAKVREKRGMPFPASSGSSGTLTRQQVYNFPDNTTAPQTDSPGYSNVRETWESMDHPSAIPCTGGASTTEAVTCYSIATVSGNEENTVTLPDGTQNVQVSRPNTSAYDQGWQIENRIVNPSTSVTVKTETLIESGGTGTGYDSARVKEIKQTNEKTQTSKTVFTFGSMYNQVATQTDYDYGASSPYRSKVFTYENGYGYTSRHIFNLVTMVDDLDASSVRKARTVYSYDSWAPAAAPGVVQHDYRHDYHTAYTQDGSTCLTWNHSSLGCTFDGEWIYSGGIPYICDCTEWEQVTAYDSTTGARGDLTNVTTYTDAAALTGAISRDYTYDVTGNQRTAETSCCAQIEYVYTDDTYQYAKPDKMIKGSASTSSPHRMTQTFIYDEDAMVPTSIVDFNGLTTTMVYDSVLRPTIVTLNSGAKQTTTYNDSSLSRTELVQKSTGEGSGTVSNSTAYFNGRGQVNKSIYQAGSSNYNATSVQYDKMGRQWKVSRPYDNASSPTDWTTSTYDFLSRVTQQQAPDGSTSAFTHNSSSAPSGASSNTGQTVATTDAWGRQRWTRTDAFGRTVEALEPDPASTTGSLTSPPTANLQTAYAYDSLDRLTAIYQGSQTREFAYDSLGRMTRQKLAEHDGSISDSTGNYQTGSTSERWSEKFSYDDRSNLTQMLDARGVVTTFSYDISSSPDPLNRLQSITYNTSGAVGTVHAAPDIAFEYMTTGNKTRVKKVTTTGVATEENIFDSEARVADYTLKFNSYVSEVLTTTYSYDSANRLTQVQYPHQYGMTGTPRKSIVPSYDQASRLTQLNVDGGTYLGSVSYNTSSQITSLTAGAATSAPRVESYSYDSQTGLLTGQTVKDTSLTNTYLDLSYGYARGGSAGSLSGKTGQMTNIVDNLNRNRDRKYEFDSLGRLVRAKGGIAAGASSVTANWTQNYTYDRYGNKTGTSLTSGSIDQNAVAPPLDGLPSVGIDPASNRINSSGWTYDRAGNLTKGQNANGVWQRFEYDAAGRLKKVIDDVSSATLETYTYGAGREKLVVQAGTSLTHYVWGGGAIIAEYTTSKSGGLLYKKNYIHAGSRLLLTTTKATVNSEKNELHHPDRLGTKVVTDGATGNWFQQSTLPFGTEFAAEKVNTGSTNQVFTSYDRSSATGLDYAVNRTYSPGQSRFTQVDPIGMSAASIGNPQSNNMYAYVQNMPTDFVDPSGLLLVMVCMPDWHSDDPNDLTVYAGQCYVVDIGGATPFGSVTPHPAGSTESGGGDAPTREEIKKAAEACLSLFAKRGEK